VRFTTRVTHSERSTYARFYPPSFPPSLSYRVRVAVEDAHLENLVPVDFDHCVH